MAFEKELNCFFVSDLHGRVERYRTLFDRIQRERPAAVFFGGDLLPSPFRARKHGRPFFENFVREFMAKELRRLKDALGDAYPRVFVILGNDDARMEEPDMEAVGREGLWDYCHNRAVGWGDFTVYGYSCIPPSPFRLKDWERYDVGDFVRPGCIAPEDGALTVKGVDVSTFASGTIETDLETLTAGADWNRVICLFHSPPHRSNLDRAGLDGRCIDGVRVDVHVGSVAIQRLIQKRQPLLTLHGHIHEAARITGVWRETFGTTISINGSHDGPELALVRFNPCCLEQTEREIL